MHFKEPEPLYYCSLSWLRLSSSLPHASLHCPRGGSDIRLNFLTNTMASSSSMDLVELTEFSAEELLINKPNSRILKVEAYISGNKLG